MKIINGKETLGHLENITYSETQEAENGADLTVNKIYKIINRGEIDFGGGERKDAEIEEIKPNFRNSEDDYGWWELEPGTYIMEYNESLIGKKTHLLQPLQRLTRNGATHPTRFEQKIKSIPLIVGAKGIAIKENSRVSRILMFES